MSKKTLCFFNSRGLIAFEKHLNLIRESGIWEPFDDILNDSTLTEKISRTVVDLPNHFSNRLECGKFFSNLFKKFEAELTAAGVDPHVHVGLWSWLSASMGEFLKGAGKEPVIGEAARWTFMPNDFGRYYRHLLAGPYMLFDMHSDQPELVEILLYNDVTKPNTAYVEQIASRPLIVDNPAAMELIHEMYFDYAKKKPRKSSVAKTAEAGDIRRFGVVFNQLALTWDVAGLSVDELRSILPKEFKPLFSQ
jgi:hypothetical protein